MECTRCKSDKIVNNGKVRGKQRMAIHLYLENMGFRAIGRVIEVSNVAVLKWIRAAGEWIQAYHERNKVQ